MKDLCRRVGISDATFYHWKAKYGGLEVSETRRLHQLEKARGRSEQRCVSSPPTKGYPACGHRGKFIGRLFGSREP
jgi:hypothetical protein